MNSCGSHELMSNLCSPITTTQHEYAQNLPSNIFNKEGKVIEGTDSRQHLLENHRKVNRRCLHSLGPPPRPFKKARYAWEIKNYDYTLKKMCQNMNNSTATSSLSSESQDPNTNEKPLTIDSQKCYAEGANFCMGTSQVCPSPKVLHDSKSAEVHMIGPPHQAGFLGPLLPTSYHTQYGAMMNGPNPASHGTPLSHNDRLNAFHTQIHPDPDARLIRWHTRRLCRSIFDNTVNRMLENMGFSPVTERSQALHPLLVLSLSDDEEREAEEAHQRTLETQALSAALHQKGLLPATYHYDPLESATTSDYDSSEEDSELGEGGPDDLTLEQHQHQQQSIIDLHPPSYGLDEDAYLALNSTQHPSFAHLVDKSLSYPHHISSLALPAEPCDHQHCSPSQPLCDYRNHCDARHSLAVESTLYSNHTEEQRLKDSSATKEKEDRTSVPGVDETLLLKESVVENNNFYSDDCGSIEETPKFQKVSPDFAEKVKIFEKVPNVDKNENCRPLSSALHQETTMIEGSVEKRTLENHHSPTKICIESDMPKSHENDNNNDSYFIRNAIHMAMKQQGLGFQKA